MKHFGLIGAAGYIAPRHFHAIKETGNVLLAAVDKHDSVGMLDSFFPEASFFTEIERFDRHLEKLKRAKGIHLDYISICSPNYLHDGHIRMSLRGGADAICEKPLVLNPWNLDALSEIESETSQKVFTILQLRLHPAIIELKRKVDLNPDKVYDIELTYITSRGLWYYASWKGDLSKSGGISSNIGIHFFDMLTWIFGEPVTNKVFLNSHDRASGILELKRARVKWFLAINSELIPKQLLEQGKRTYRSITIDEEEIEFSGGFTDLHVESYRRILSNAGYGIEDARPSIELVHKIRGQSGGPLVGDYHTLCRYPIAEHPFIK